MKCHRIIGGVSYVGHITNCIAQDTNKKTGSLEDLIAIIKRRKLKCYGDVNEANNLSTTIKQPTILGNKQQADKTPLTELEDHLLKLRYKHATETYGESWSGTELCSNPTTTPGHENDDELWQLLPVIEKFS